MALNKAHYDTIAEAQSSSIPSYIKICQLSGQTYASDGKGFLYYRVDANPSNSWAFRSADRYLSTGASDSVNGGWWLRAKEYLGLTYDFYSDGIQIGSSYQPNGSHSLSITNDGTSPGINRIVFGTDNTGYVLSFGYNYNGTITERIRIGDNAYGGGYALHVLGNQIISGNILPNSTATYNLGHPSYRWNIIYTSDLSLKNDHGDWTIVEGEDDLFLYNNKKNKVYKFALTEVDPSVAPAKKVVEDDN